MICQPRKHITETRPNDMIMIGQLGRPWRSWKKPPTRETTPKRNMTPKSSKTWRGNCWLPLQCECPGSLLCAMVQVRKHVSQIMPRLRPNPMRMRNQPRILERRGAVTGSMAVTIRHDAFSWREVTHRSLHVLRDVALAAGG